MTTFDAYGLIYTRDNFEIDIIDCVFENNFGFIGLIQCARYSYCHVNIKNCVFINNVYDYNSTSVTSRSCYNGEPIINSIYLENNAQAVLVMRDSTFYFRGPTVIYDSSSSVSIANISIIDQVSGDDYDYYCRETAETLYLSKNVSDNNNDRNDCTDENDPCSSWNSIIASVRSGDKIKIANGIYTVYIPLQVDLRSSTLNVETFGGAVINYTIIGNGKEKTMLHVAQNVTNFLYFDMDDASSSFGGNVKIPDLTYYPLTGLDQRFGYFYYGTSPEFSNIIVNGKKGDSNSSYDMISTDELTTLVIDNMEIYDIVSGSSNREIFSTDYTDTVIISNVVVRTCNKSSDSNIHFGYFSRGHNSIDVENITIKDYYSSYTMSFDDNWYCDIRLNNVAMDNVYGGVFFYFGWNYYTDITMNNILIDGNDKNLENGILFYDYNKAKLDISNSVFQNFEIIHNFTKMFDFYRDSSSNYFNKYIIFDNVLFENMKSFNSNNYGLIYISDNFNITFNNCKFRNNVGFVAMIHCNDGSHCNISIQDSTFYKNNNGYYNCMSY